MIAGWIVEIICIASLAWVLIELDDSE